GPVRVLVLVDHDVLEALLIFLEHVRVAIEQPHRSHQEVIEVERVVLFEERVIAQSDPGRQLLGVRAGRADLILGGDDLVLGARAALFVKVTARISPGSARPCWISHAIRWVKTRVLPLQATAKISSGPSSAVTAARCGRFKPASKSTARSAAAGVVDAKAKASLPGAVTRNQTGPMRRPAAH